MADIKPDAERPPPWGYFATLAWALLALLLAVVAGALAQFAWDTRYGSYPGLEDQPLSILLTATSGAVAVCVIAIAARLRHWLAREYLGLIRPSRRDVVVALVSLIVLGLISDAVSYLLGEEIPLSQLNEYWSAKEANMLPLYWIEGGILAPVTEEIMTRGFLQRGWVRSQYGVVPGIVVISALWAIAHTQYEWLGVLDIFVLGLLLGWIRWRSGSTLLTILMHAIAGVWAGMATMVKVEWLS